jgi:hypothetical protein
MQSKRELKILSMEEFGLLLYRVNCLPFKESQSLEKELKERYRQCLENLYELEILAGRIRDKWPLKQSDKADNDSMAELISILVTHSPIEFETEIIAGEPLENTVS